MSNEEVLNFLERFSGCSNPKGIKAQYPLKSSNATLSRLLCEEARRRWIKVVKSEGVMIDDISCLVLDLGEDSISKFQNLPEKVLRRRTSIDDIKESLFGSLALSRNNRNCTSSIK